MKFSMTTIALAATTLFTSTYALPGKETVHSAKSTEIEAILINLKTLKAIDVFVDPKTLETRLGPTVSADIAGKDPKSKPFCGTWGCNGPCGGYDCI